jgi:hypothetical protein
VLRRGLLRRHLLQWRLHENRDGSEQLRWLRPRLRERSKLLLGHLLEYPDRPG